MPCNTHQSEAKGRWEGFFKQPSFWHVPIHSVHQITPEKKWLKCTFHMPPSSTPTPHSQEHKLQIYVPWSIRVGGHMGNMEIFPIPHNRLVWYQCPKFMHGALHIKREWNKCSLLNPLGIWCCTCAKVVLQMFKVYKTNLIRTTTTCIYITAYLTVALLLWLSSRQFT